MAESLEILLEDMISDVVRLRHLPLEEVRSWVWKRLLRTYRQIGKSKWDELSSSIVAIQSGVGRALHQALSKKPLQKLPDYDEIANQDPFEAPPKPVEDVWLEYERVNKVGRFAYLREQEEEDGN